MRVPVAVAVAQRVAGAPCSLVVVGATAVDEIMYALNAADGSMVWLQHAGKGPSVDRDYSSQAAFANINSSGKFTVVAGSDRTASCTR